MKFNIFIILIPLINCKSFHDFSVKDISGKQISLKQYAGKVVLVVNVASECGYTDEHYRSLVRMQKGIGDTKHFQILAFPCNQFGGQEPKKEEAILKFAKEKFDVNFPIFSKINVINENIDPLWKFLQEESNVTPTWNFFKYLIDTDGKVVGGWGPDTKADDMVPHILPLVEKRVHSGAKFKKEL